MKVSKKKIFILLGFLVTIGTSYVYLFRNKTTLINKMKNKIASFKIPKEVLFVDELPRNAMGKVQKNRLRERFS